MKISTRQGINAAFIGITVSIFNAVVQFLTIYWILEKFGAQFNGYVRLMTSISALNATAEGSLGIATTIMLIRPISSGDWISANEIYSASKRNYRKGAIISLIMIIAISVLYPLYLGISNNMTGKTSTLSFDSTIMLSGTNQAKESMQLWSLILLNLIFGSKSFLIAFQFAIYENIISANSKQSVNRIITLFTDITVYGSMFLLLSVDNINPILPFTTLIFYSVIKGLLIYIYVKRKFVWLKYQRDAYNLKLNDASNKLSKSSYAHVILVNTDVIVASILLGLNISSYLSLYLVIGTNIRLIMTNLIVSFREFFATLIAKKGRIYWKSYAKYELYIYIIAGFTFINISILSPYFVSSLYGDMTRQSVNSSVIGDANTKIATSNALDYIFFSYKFSVIYGACTALIIMCEAQITLIQSKGRNSDVSKVQNIIAGSYLIVIIIFIGLTTLFGWGGNQYLINGIKILYISKLVSLVITYLFLWVYVWKYVAYNSNFNNVLENLGSLFIPITCSVLFVIFYLDKQFNIIDATDSQTGSFLTLVGLFFGSVFGSVVLIMITAILINWRNISGIIYNLPLINKILTKKANESREKRLKEYGLDITEAAVDNEQQFSQAIINIVEDNKVNLNTKYTYKIKDEKYKKIKN